MPVKDLVDRWLDYKQQEEKAKANRRLLEDSIIEEVGLQSLFGGKDVLIVEPFVLTITARRTIETRGSFSAVAAGAGIDTDALVEWRGRINPNAWERLPPEVKHVLLPGVKTTQLRHSFEIKTKE